MARPAASAVAEPLMTERPSSARPEPRVYRLGTRYSWNGWWSAISLTGVGVGVASAGSWVSTLISAMTSKRSWRGITPNASTRVPQ
jgi:hypothetical protein